MTPVGHASVSYIIGNKFDTRYLLVFLIGSLIPDIDFILLPFGIFNSAHRVITHNFFFLLLCLIAVMIILRTVELKMLLLFIAGGLIHFFLDAILDANPSNGTGVALLWPLSDALISPFNLLGDYKSVYTWEQPLRFIISLSRSFLIEIPFICIALIFYIKNRRNAL